jgi:capsular exopolysaccharide synthesis family protein
MAEKIIYGNRNSGPVYYGGKSSYGARNPAYYGGGVSYGQRPYGGTYGGPQYGGMGNGQEASMIGSLSPKRILRVVSQRWLSVFVFLLLGIVISFVVYRVSPTVYESACTFMIDMRRASGHSRNIAQAMQDYGNNYAEVFNTRKSSWKSEKLMSMVVQEYRASNLSSTVPDEEIIKGAASADFAILRGSRIIALTVSSQSPKLAAGIANAYVKSIESYTDEENKIHCDKAVSQIHENAEKKRLEVEKLAKELYDFRSAHKVDNLRSSRDTLRQALLQTNTDILNLESSETQLVEWEKMLSAVQKNPESFGTLSTGIPRAQEIATEYRAFLDAKMVYDKLLVVFREAHPEVLSKKSELETSRQRFLDATARALQTGKSNLLITRNRLAQLRTKREDLKNELSSISQRIVLAESGLGILEKSYEVANRLFEGLVMDENKARLEAEANNAIIILVNKANIPSKPVSPNPLFIFGVGIMASLAFGFLFVLVLDNLEDTIVNLSDIEVRLSLKVLAVLPHVRRKRREHVARYIMEDSFSQFSETVAGLRNLLDSPRYEAMTQCMLVISTQPGEGKTITSTSLAITFAQVGRKVLHVDFDMRRPRLARVWDLDLDLNKSFSHTLNKNDSTPIDFSKLVNKTELPGLDVIASLPPEGVSPATIFGSSVVGTFFEWARANYDKIIIDSPPYGIVGDVVSLAVQADSVIIMCCPDRTHFRPIQFCARALTEAGANILGVVVNDIEVSSVSAFSPSVHHRYQYGYGYGTRGYGYRDDTTESTDEVEETENGKKDNQGAKSSSHVHERESDEFADDE